MSKLIVAKWEDKSDAELTSNGLVRINPNKPEYGSLMLLHKTSTLNKGFLNKRTKVGFITGRVDDLKELITDNGLRENVNFSEKMGEHKIVTLELVQSEVPDNQGYREKINPSTEEVLTKDGEPIYWKTEVVSEGSDIADKFIQHDVEGVDAAVEEFSASETARK